VPCRAAWEVLVADAKLWGKDDKLEDDPWNSGLVAFEARVDAETGDVALRSDSMRPFISVTLQQKLAQQRARGEALFMATPEFRLEARTSTKPLGVMTLADQPCRDDDKACTLEITALRVCPGCAGHWRTAQYTPATDALQVESEPADYVDYESFRALYRRSGNFKDMRFPARENGKGPLGYGDPSGSDSSAPVAVSRALEGFGSSLQRVDRYGAFRVYVAQGGRRGSLTSKTLAPLRAAVLAATGNLPCEVVLGDTRVQFDRMASYELRAGSFQPLP
jgi:hypothetical protein